MNINEHYSVQFKVIKVYLIKRNKNFTWETDHGVKRKSKRLPSGVCVRVCVLVPIKLKFFYRNNIPYKHKKC